jgi:hypothetical protein
MKVKIIVIIIVISFIQNIGFAQKNEVETALNHLYRGRLDAFGMYLTKESVEELEYYFFRYEILEVFEQQYELHIGKIEKGDNNTSFVLVEINNSIFRVPTVKDSDNKFKLIINESLFSSFYWQEPLLSSLMGYELFHDKQGHRSFPWFYQSAKTGFFYALKFLFDDFTRFFYIDSSNEKLEKEEKQKLVSLLNVEPIDNPFDSTNNEISEDMRSRIETDKMHMFLHDYDYELFMTILEERAAKGSTDAMNQLANEYPYDWTNYAGKEKRLFWYHESAIRGDELGIYEMGRLNEDTLLHKIDYEQAFYWYNKLYKQNPEHEVILNLVDFYYNGKGVQQDKAKALELLKKAEEIASTSEYHRLAEKIGNIYYGDIPELKNHERACIFYNLALEYSYFISRACEICDAERPPRFIFGKDKN